MSRDIIPKLRGYRISLDDRWLDRQSDGETLAIAVRPRREREYVGTYVLGKSTFELSLQVARRASRIVGGNEARKPRSDR